MIYNSFQDVHLSALGFGAMRLPVIGGGQMLICVGGRDCGRDSDRLAFGASGRHEKSDLQCFQR